MMKAWRPLAIAAALNATIGVGVAMAQTVIVRSAPPGATIELVLNAAKIGSATADAKGDATLPVNLTANAGKAETDAFIYVDTCDNVRSVILVERAAQPPPQERGCDRRQIVGLFLVRRVSTLVVNVAGPNPTVLLRQGSVSLEPGRTWSPSPTGFVLFGGGGLAKFRDARALACGTVEQCSGKDSKLAYTGGVAYWFSRFLAAEASYLRPSEVTVDGSAEGFRFNSFLDAHVVTIAGKVGIPAGKVRLYGQAGTNYHRATSGTTQTIDDSTVTIDDVTVTIEGGTQTFSLETGGWGWQFGGGVEAWVRPAFAIYAEGGLLWLKGSALDDADGRLEERLTHFLVGGRIRIGR